MSAASKAVFLSYAHEDAATSRRLAEAMRAAGVEVWFDQSELRGGDAWDAKIRKQIKDCGLFVPVVSANTQARREGYFRLEWRLADQRTHLMGRNATFIVPVCLDPTPDEEADVPDSFLKVQWTRFPVRKDANGKVQKEPDELDLSDFAEFLKQLLAAGDLQFTPAPFTGPAAEPEAPRGPVEIVSEPAKRGWPQMVAIIGMIAVCGLVAWFALRPKEEAPGVSPRTEAGTKSPAVVAPPEIEEKSIAVLPFKNESPDAANAFFTDGVHEDILTSLYNIRDVDVRPRTSVEHYRDAKKTLKQISAELRVAYVLEGSVRREGNKVRVTAQLSDARTDRQAWAKSYDKELSDIFAIQAELAKAIASELHAVISPQVAKLLETKPTDNPLAYDKYLQARAVKNRRDPDANNKALALVNEAVVLDPKFGLGWAWVAYHYGQDYLVVSNSPAQLTKANAAMEVAMRLAPHEPEMVLVRGYHYYNQRDYDRATEYFEQFAQLQPNSAIKHWAFSAPQRRQGKWMEAMANLRRATQLEPDNADYANLLGQLLLAGRRYPEAIAEYTRLAALPGNSLQYEFMTASIHFLMRGSPEKLDAFFQRLTPEQAKSMRVRRRAWEMMTGKLEPGNVRSDEALVLIALKGDRAEVRARSEDRTTRLREELQAGPENWNNWGDLARLEALRGNREEALRCALKAVELLPESQDRISGPRPRADLAFVYTWIGDKDRAIAEYAHLLSEPVQNNYILENVHVMRIHPQFAPLRGDPRFEALLNDPKNNQPLF